MTLIFIVYFLFLLAWGILSFFVTKQLIMYGFVGDATKTMIRLYFFISAIIFSISLIVILLI